MNCKPEIILESEHYNVARCTTCGRIGLYYKNILLGFNPADFHAFTRSIHAVTFDKSAVDFPDGQKHLVMNTCHKDIQFTFTREEFEEFQDLLQQAVLLLETKVILGNC